MTRLDDGHGKKVAGSVYQQPAVLEARRVFDVRRVDHPEAGSVAFPVPLSAAVLVLPVVLSMAPLVVPLSTVAVFLAKARQQRSSGPGSQFCMKATTGNLTSPSPPYHAAEADRTCWVSLGLTDILV